MGNQEGSEQQSEAQFQGYISQLHFMRKEHQPNIGRDIDLYKDLNPEFPEELILMYEITFEEDSQGDEVEKLERFKKDVNKRKFINSVHLSQMLFVNYKVLNGICFKKVMCRISLQYSDQNLGKLIHQSKISRGSQLQNQFVPEQQVLNFLHQMSDALVCLKNNGEVHGFVMPENILVLNKNHSNPIFKLLEVALLSRYHSCFDRMVTEHDYFAPLDQTLLNSLASHQPSSYHSENDVWSLGITTLCYIFNEDFSIFYDWNAKQVKQQKIEQFMSIMNKVNYSQNLLQIVNGMLQPEYSRIDAETIFNKTFQQIYFAFNGKLN